MNNNEDKIILLIIASGWDRYSFIQDIWTNQFQFTYFVLIKTKYFLQNEMNYHLYPKNQLALPGIKNRNL